MAELRRVGGSMEPHRRPAGRRALLPAEVQLCNAVGLNEDEYWYFVDAAEQYNGKRDPAYDLIPDIRCDPVVTPILVNLAIGLVLTGVSVLLAPKPKSPQTKEDKTPPPLTLGGSENLAGYAQTNGFQSVQDLARLGQTIPLVFAKKGVRVNGQLLWSQMIAEPRAQQLRALFCFSDGVTEGQPDYKGLAIGDSLLSTYTAQKVRAYWRQGEPEGVMGNRIRENNALPGSQLPGFTNQTDTFSTAWDVPGQRQATIEPFFSGATFTSIQSEFGAYSPMANNTGFLPVPELIIVPDDADDDFQDALINKKKLQNRLNPDNGRPWFSQGSFFVRVRNPAIPNGFLGHEGTVEPGPNGEPYDQISYRLTTYLENPEDSRFEPNKLNFINSATTQSRQTADQNIALGELYLIGDTAMGVCTTVESSQLENAPWAPDNNRAPYQDTPSNDKNYWFTVTERGYVDCIPATSNDTAAAEVNAINNPFEAYQKFPLQRAAVGTFSNTRPCQATELVIKSNVWRQVSGFSDISAWPSQELIEEYEETGGSISLGPLSKYMKRLSFFMLEVRRAGVQAWTNITGDKFFFVEGNSPVDQYNYIRVALVEQINTECEFRLRPVSGAAIIRRLRTFGSIPMRRLRLCGIESKYTSNGYLISYSGDGDVDPVIYNGVQSFQLTQSYVTNPDFILPPDNYEKENEGAIDNLGIQPQQTGNTEGVPVLGPWTTAETRYNTNIPRNFVTKKLSNTNANFSAWAYLWDDSIIGQGTYPSPAFEPPEVQLSETMKFIWALQTPGRENLTINEPDGLRVFRTIVRQERRLQWLDGADNIPDFGVVVDFVPYEDGGAMSASGTGLKIFVQEWQNDIGGYIGARFTVDAANQGSGYQPGDRGTVSWTNNFGYPRQQELQITGTVTTTVTETDRQERNYAPFDACSDLPAFQAVTSSNSSGPEHAIVAVNEKRSQFTPKYEYMTLGGLRINSSTEWSNFSSYSAWMKKGIILENLIGATEGTIGPPAASNLLPDIVYGMMTNPRWGAGSTIGPGQADKMEMKIASQFCQANDFTWDGVVSERINFRDWVFRNAQYCLLDATVIGGRFALTPAVPFKGDFKIDAFAKPEIKALFTDGNMKDMTVEFLSPDDRQLFKAEMLWRRDTVNGFAVTEQFTVRLVESQGGSESDPVETYDMSQFCTSESHALIYAYYALKVRQCVDHAITFQTTPQAAMNLSPGDYFKVSSTASHTSRFNNGSINDDGYITSSEDFADGTYAIYYWRPGTEGISEASISIVGGRCSDVAFHNTVFTLKTTEEQSRVYKLESLTYGEDGLIEVTGSHMPLTDIGSLEILNWNPNFFVATGVGE